MSLYDNYSSDADGDKAQIKRNDFAIKYALMQHFTEPIGNVISKDKINEIMQYLDRQYEFTSKVFSDQKAIFSVLDYSHTEFNSECMTAFSELKVKCTGWKLYCPIHCDCAQWRQKAFESLTSAFC